MALTAYKTPERDMMHLPPGQCGTVTVAPAGHRGPRQLLATGPLPATAQGGTSSLWYRAGSASPDTTAAPDRSAAPGT
jgi:hypothetical protein